MRVFLTVKAAFFAGHILPEHSVCGRHHGHDWTISVTLQATPDPKTGLVVDHGDLLVALQRVAAQFAGRDINELLPGLPPTPENLTGVIHEGLLMEFPNIVAVEVGNGVAVARGEWDLR